MNIIRVVGPVRKWHRGAGQPEAVIGVTRTPTSEGE